MKKSVKVILTILVVLLIDQGLKFWVKTNMYYGETIPILGLDWALIHFVENPGMAFGLSLGGDYGKLALSLFRILAVGFLIYYIRLLLKSGVSFGLLLSFALILAGALGNIIDSAIYGLIFSDSTHGEIARLFPAEGGYESFLHGRVVDMLYFPIINGTFPSWFPFWGGEDFLFFKPVFNIADSAITAGVLNILLFQRSFFSSQAEQELTSEEMAENDSSDTNPSESETGDSITSNDTTSEEGKADEQPPSPTEEGTAEDEMESKA